MKQVLIARLVEMAASSLGKQVVDSNVKPTDIQGAAKAFKTALLKDPKLRHSLIRNPSLQAMNSNS